MIQDIEPAKFKNQYCKKSPKSQSNMFYFKDGKLLAFYDETEKCVRVPAYSMFGADTKSVFAFSIDTEDYFLAFDTKEIPQGFEFYDIRTLRDLEMSGNLFMFCVFSAYHLWKWYITSRFCGCCGEKTVHDLVERAMVCPKCGNRIYPRINPAVIIGVTKGDEIILTKYARGYAHNALIAGFVEFGETLEETVAREVMEEVGLKVKNIRYYKSQPWGCALDLLAGFYCEVDGKTEIHMDKSELKYAKWVKREDIELQPNEYSLTNEMMKLFKEGKI